MFAIGFIGGTTPELRSGTTHKSSIRCVLPRVMGSQKFSPGQWIQVAVTLVSFVIKPTGQCRFSCTVAVSLSWACGIRKQMPEPCTLQTTTNSMEREFDNGA